MYKKFKKSICLLLVVLLCASIGAASASSPIRVLLDGSPLQFDVPPQMIDGRTMVPMRAIFEALGAEVLWNERNQNITATRDDLTIILMINADRMYINSMAFRIDAPPTVIGGRTFVPLRVVSEALGAEVAWDGNARTVTIVSESLQEPTEDYENPEDWGDLSDWDWDSWGDFDGEEDIKD
ncbi:MAG: copper amine oxidase N-terminal domain-containing protein [Oscillospiraceae bacterium]|nr:copper amine oxidase N-terminal domain-containing protein [Oscillospiraceae bacterium]